MQHNELKIFVRGAYDIQKIRIEMGNRLVGNFKAKLGFKPSKKEDDNDDKDAKKILKELKKSYKKITDGVTTKAIPKAAFKGDGVISMYAEYQLLSQYITLEASENKHFRTLGNMLEEVPIYTEYLRGVCGVGPAMAGMIVTEIDIHKAKYPSSIWKYCGLDVAPDGCGRSKKEGHLVEVEYIDKSGKTQTRNSITFNPLIKTKLLGVLGPSFLRSKSDYSNIYNGYKHRLENHEKYKDVSKGHRHNMAIRYMVKRFLVDLYRAWRELEGLPVAPEYSEAKLGMKHGS